MTIARTLRRTAAALIATTALAGPVSAQVLFNNGAAVDGGGLSIVRAGGSVLGFGAQSSLNNAVADDFSVGGSGWNVTGFSLFAYQTGATAFPFTGVSWSIISGDVNTGTVVASGSTAPANGGLAGYRVTGTTLTSTARAIYQLDVDIADVVLGPGSFWLRWGMEGVLTSGPWQPTTADGVVGNAQQSLASAAFTQALDSGDGQGVELPFLIYGSRVSTVPEPASIALLLTGAVALAGAARRRRLS